MDERELIQKLIYALEDVMETDPDMPSHQSTMDDAEKLLEQAKQFLQESPPK